MKLSLNCAASFSHVDFSFFADEDTVTGFLLAGVGNVDSKRKSNFLVVGSKTTQGEIEEAFRRFTNPDTKPPIGVLLLAQSVAGEIRHLLDDYNQVHQKCFLLHVFGSNVVFFRSFLQFSKFQPRTTLTTLLQIICCRECGVSLGRTTESLKRIVQKFHFFPSPSEAASDDVWCKVSDPDR